MVYVVCAPLVSRWQLKTDDLTRADIDRYLAAFYGVLREDHTAQNITVPYNFY